MNGVLETTEVQGQIQTEDHNMPHYDGLTQYDVEAWSCAGHDMVLSAARALPLASEPSPSPRVDPTDERQGHNVCQ